MDATHERAILSRLAAVARRHRTPLELTIFSGAAPDGAAMTIQQQASLFGEAAAVVGPHGGALANLLWLPSQGALHAAHQHGCDTRPAVLEFVCGNRSRSVQAGCPYSPSYWTLFSGAPWVDYHLLAFASRSTDGTTWVDLEELESAVATVFGRKACGGR